MATKIIDKIKTQVSTKASELGSKINIKTAEIGNKAGKLGSKINNKASEIVNKAGKISSKINTKAAEIGGNVLVKPGKEIVKNALNKVEQISESLSKSAFTQLNKNLDNILQDYQNSSEKLSLIAQIQQFRPALNEMRQNFNDFYLSGQNKSPLDGQKLRQLFELGDRMFKNIDDRFKYNSKVSNKELSNIYLNSIVADFRSFNEIIEDLNEEQVLFNKNKSSLMGSYVEYLGQKSKLFMSDASQQYLVAYNNNLDFIQNFKNSIFEASKFKNENKLQKIVNSTNNFEELFKLIIRNEANILFTKNEQIDKKIVQILLQNHLINQKLSQKKDSLLERSYLVNFTRESFNKYKEDYNRAMKNSLDGIKSGKLTQIDHSEQIEIFLDDILGHNQKIWNQISDGKEMPVVFSDYRKSAKAGNKQDDLSPSAPPFEYSTRHSLGRSGSVISRPPEYGDTIKLSSNVGNSDDHIYESIGNFDDHIYENIDNLPNYSEFTNVQQNHKGSNKSDPNSKIKYKDCKQIDPDILEVRF